MYGESMGPVERIAGQGSARLVRPLISSEFLDERPQSEARQLARTARAGSHGRRLRRWLGRRRHRGRRTRDRLDPRRQRHRLPGRAQRAAARAALRGLRRRAARARLRLHRTMPEILAAADTSVHSTGGVTCLEAKATGTPVVSYGLPVGHARLNTRAMADLGPPAPGQRHRELRAHVQAASPSTMRAGPGRAPARGLVAVAGQNIVAAPELADEVASVRTPRGSTRSKRRRAGAGCPPSRAPDSPVATAPGGLRDPVRAAGRGQHLVDVHRRGDRFRRRSSCECIRSSVSTPPSPTSAWSCARRPASATLAAASWPTRGIHASFTDNGLPTRASTIAGLRALHDELVPEVPRSGSPLRWVRTRGTLRSQARALGLAPPLLLPAAAERSDSRPAGAGPYRGRAARGRRRAAQRHWLASLSGVRAGDVLVVSVDGCPSSVVGARAHRLLAALGRALGRAAGLADAPRLPSRRARAASAPAPRPRDQQQREHQRHAAERRRAEDSPSSSGASITGTTV